MLALLAPVLVFLEHRQLARNPQDAQREDDENKSALFEVLKLRHEYAQHPEGWVARKKRSNAVKEGAQRWGVTDSGATCSRVGPNYQVVVPELGGASEYSPTEISTETFRAPSPAQYQVLQEYLAAMEPLYKVHFYTKQKNSESQESAICCVGERYTVYLSLLMISSQSVQDYVLQRRSDRKSYRDIGTFREWACEQLHAADFDFEVPFPPFPFTSYPPPSRLPPERTHI